MGWIPDLPDHRDYRYAATRGPLTAPAELPEKVDLRPYASAVEDQGNLGSCTANATVSALELLDKKAGDATPENDSRLFIYYNARAAIGMTGEDSGAYLRDAVKSVAKLGVCLESYLPYKIANFRRKPTSGAYTRALKRRIADYARLDGQTDALNCLASGYPFVFGFSVFESFESDAVASTGMMPMPEPTEQLLGGHAVLAVGYDRPAQLLIVENSWGNEWGDKGFFYMPFAYAFDNDYADDRWVIRR